MPTKRRPDRDAIVAEVLQNTNKPRFCYLGYAPPLCIGDDFGKSARGTNPSSDKPPAMKIPGTRTYSLFSMQSSLCIGDPFIDKEKSNRRVDNVSSDRPRFKPPGKSPDVPIIPHIPTPQALDPPNKSNTIGPRNILVTNGGGFFHHYSDEPKIVKEEATQPAPVVFEKPPFRVSCGNHGGLFGPLIERPVEDRPVEERPVDGKHNVKKSHSPSDTGIPAFKPAGISGIKTPYPEYLPQSAAVVDRDRNRTVSGASPSWKMTCVPLLSSPTSSVAMNMINLSRA